MRCAEIMSKNLETLSERDSVRAAAAVMAESGVGFLPVCDARGKPIGVVTDRDIATRAVAKNLSLGDTSAAMIMTAPAITCLDTNDVRDAEQLMAEQRKSRLVVTDREGRAVGVLSLADLIEYAPSREALRTAKAVLWREALGPRGGAEPGEPLLKDDPMARAQKLDDGAVKPSEVFTGRRELGPDIKVFPG